MMPSLNATDSLSCGLALLVMIPLLGALLTLGYASRRQYLAPLFSGLVLAVAVFIVAAVQANPGLNGFGTACPLRPGWEADIGIAGSGILFVLTTALLIFLLSLREGGETGQYPSGGFSALLGLEALLMALFTTSNLLYFTGLASLVWIGLGYLPEIRLTGQPTPPAARLFRHFMLSSLMLLWIATVLLGLHHARLSGIWSWELADLAKTPLSATWQKFVFLLLFYAAAIPLAQFPLHTWLPELTRQPGISGLVILVTGAKAGLYLLVGFELLLLPDAVEHFRHLVAGLGVAGIFYGIAQAFMQIRLHRRLAFVLVSQTGMLLVGLFSLNADGFSGSLLLSFDFSLAAAGLFLTADSLLRRTGTLSIRRLGGLFDSMPLLAITFLLAVLGTLALPATPGFDAAHRLLKAILETQGWGMAIAVATGNVLSVALLLYAFHKIFLSRKPEKVLRLTRDQARWPETLRSGLICLLLLGAGFYAEPWTHLLHATTSHLTCLYRPQAFEP